MSTTPTPLPQTFQPIGDLSTFKPLNAQAPQQPTAAPKTGMQQLTDTIENSDKSPEGYYTPLMQGIGGAVKSGANMLGTTLDMLNKGGTLARKFSDTSRRALLGDDAANHLHQMEAPADDAIQKHVQDAAGWLRSAGQPQGFWENVGGVGEQVLELLGTDGLLKLASAPAAAVETGSAVSGTMAHLKQAQQVATILKQNPKLAGLVTIGLKASKDALTQGAQQYMHTEDPEQAAEAALAGGATSGVFGLADKGLAALRGGAEDAVSRTRNIGGRDTVLPKQPAPTPAQAAGQKAITGNAQEILGSQLGELNESRVIPPGETSTAKEPLWMTPEDVQSAHRDFDRLDTTINSPNFKQMPPEQQNYLRGEQAKLREQLLAHEGQAADQAAATQKGLTAFEPVNIPDTVQKIGSHTEAADALHRTIVQGYDQLADRAGLSGQSMQTYTALKNDYQEAEQGVRGANGKQALQAAESSASEAHQELVNFFDRVGVNPKEVAGLNDGYRNYTTIRDVAKAVDGAFNINPYLSRDAGLYRGFNGDKLKENLSALIDKYGAPALQRVMGRDGLNSLSEVAEMNSTRAGASDFGQATNAIAKYLSTMTAHGTRLVGAAGGAALAHSLGLSGWEGYAAGAAGGMGVAEGGRQATRAVWNAITTNPRIAENVVFALKGGARVQNYAPYIARMIAAGGTQQKGEGQQ